MGSSLKILHAACKVFGKGGEKMLEGYKTTLTMDSKGRIVIPIKVREAMGMKEADLLALVYQDGVIEIFVTELEKK
jgi:AbrB family looped-hinge helix DNA binding protein